MIQLRYYNSRRVGETLRRPGGPRSNVGSIHRQSVIAILEPLRESGVRWMHGDARSAEDREIARNWDGGLKAVGRAEADREEGLPRVHGWLFEAQGRQNSAGHQYRAPGEPGNKGMDQNVAANGETPISSLSDAGQPSCACMELRSGRRQNS